MTKLALIAMLLLWPDRVQRRAPTDIESMNRFAAEYNAYVGTMQDGIVDVRQWERVEKAWAGVK